MKDKEKCVSKVKLTGSKSGGWVIDLSDNYGSTTIYQSLTKKLLHY